MFSSVVLLLQAKKDFKLKLKLPSKIDGLKHDVWTIRQVNLPSDFETFIYQDPGYWTRPNCKLNTIFIDLIYKQC